MKSHVRNILFVGIAVSTIILAPFIFASRVTAKDVPFISTSRVTAQYVRSLFAPRVAAQDVPTLIIRGLDDGSTITLPAEIQYEVTGFQVGEQTGGHMNIYVGDPEISDQIEIPLEGQSGIAILPDDKRIPGVKDLTFHLADANNKLLPNPEAKVTFKNLIIQGRR